jgi:hypothetical protein
MSLSRKRLQRRIAASSNRTHKAVELIIVGGLPVADRAPTIEARYPIETRVVAKGVDFFIRSNLQLPVDDDGADADIEDAAS